MSEQELLPVQTPAIGISQPLSVAELRWCMSQEIALQAMQPMLGTRGAIDYYNELGDDFNGRCGGREYSQGDREEAMKSTNEVREEIVAAAVEDIQRVNDTTLTRQIQERLAILGYEVAIDGVFGTQTEAAIRAFQLRVGIPADGLMSQRLVGRLQVEYLRLVHGRE